MKMILIRRHFHLESFWKGVGECRGIQSYKALTKICHLVSKMITLVIMMRIEDEDDSCHLGK